MNFIIYVATEPDSRYAGVSRAYVPLPTSQYGEVGGRKFPDPPTLAAQPQPPLRTQGHWPPRNTPTHLVYFCVTFTVGCDTNFIGKTHAPKNDCFSHVISEEKYIPPKRLLFIMYPPCLQKKPKIVKNPKGVH